MIQVLFIAHMPNAGIGSDDPDAWSRWLGFEEVSRSIAANHAKTQVLSKNVFLHPQSGSDVWLAQLVTAIQASKFSHSTFFISGELATLTK